MFEFDVKIDPVQRPDFDHDAPAPDPIPDSIPSLTKMLVLAHQIHRAVEASPLTDYAEIARQIGVSRARVSQIVRMRHLAPAIQNVILCEPHRVAHMRERHVRDIFTQPDHGSQWRQFEALLEMPQFGSLISIPSDRTHPNGSEPLAIKTDPSAFSEFP